MLYHVEIVKGILKHFISLRICFAEVKTKLRANSQFLMVCYFTELHQSQNALNTRHLNVNCTKMQLSLTATLTGIVHHKLTQRYLAAHSCVKSG